MEAAATTLAQAMADNSRHSLDSTTVRVTVVRPAPAGQLAGLLHPAGDLSLVELVAFPHVEGALGFGRKGAGGTGVREAPSKKTSLR